MTMNVRRVKMGLVGRNDGGCKPCPFSRPGKGTASDPEYQSPPGKDDPDCFTKTGDAFLSSLDAASPSAPRDITKDGCKVLAGIGDGGQIFHALYELDKTYCGLGPSKRAGDDPTINSILTNCSSHYGIANLVDPGWPSATYQCTLCTSIEQAQTGATSSRSASSTSATSVPPRVNKAGTVPSATTTKSTYTAGAVTSSTSPTVPSMAPATTTTTPPLATTTSPNDDITLSPANQLQVPTQGIVAIVVCVTIAIAAAITLLLCVLRRRRKQQEAMYSGGGSSAGGMSSRLTNDHHAATPGGGGRGDTTYEPLLSPSHSLSGDRPPPPPLTPPARLRDRKLLLPALLRPLSLSRSSDEALGKSQLPKPFATPVPSLHHHKSSNSSSLYNSPAQKQRDAALLAASTTTTTTTTTKKTAPAISAKNASPFPSSPLCAPTRATKKLEPRQERMRALPPPLHQYTRLKAPPPVSFTFPQRSSLDTTTTSSTGVARSPPPPPPAPKSRHRRGTVAAAHNHSSKTYASSLLSSSTISDATDHQPHPRTLFSSPTRPQRPHDGPLEIPDLVRPSSPALMIGVARTTTSISLQSLAEGHHHHHQQNRHRRDSWGSWEGGGGGGGAGEDEGEPAVGKMFGVSFPPARVVGG